MTNPSKPHASSLPHHKLVAYGVAVELLLAVKAANIRDAKLRDEAVRAAKGACLNCAEGAGRASRADKARVFAIARGEAVEAIAAVEIAAHAGDTTAAAAERCVLINRARREAREALAVGREQGREDGLHKGLRKGREVAILLLLQARGLPVSEAEQRRIAAERDLAVLDRWLRASVAAASVAEVLEGA